jgi:hypothetical protein
MHIKRGRAQTKKETLPTFEENMNSQTIRQLGAPPILALFWGNVLIALLIMLKLKPRSSGPRSSLMPRATSDEETDGLPSLSFLISFCLT